MFFDALVHQRLRITGLISFVVTKSPEPNHIEHDVLVKSLSIFKRDAHGAIGGFRIVTVDVKYGRLRHTRNVSRINRRAARFRRSGKSNLVVDDDMNRAAGPIPMEL